MVLIGLSTSIVFLFKYSKKYVWAELQSDIIKFNMKCNQSINIHWTMYVCLSATSLSAVKDKKLHKSETINNTLWSRAMIILKQNREMHNALLNAAGWKLIFFNYAAFCDCLVDMWYFSGASSSQKALLFML